MEIGASATPAIQGANEMRAWDQAKCNGGSGAFYGTGYPVPMLATKLQTPISKERTGNEEIIQLEEQAENIDKFIGKVRKYLDLDELTPTVLNDMVKAVYVHTPDKSNGHREQQIDISYDLVGILPASLLADL